MPCNFFDLEGPFTKKRQIRFRDELFETASRTTFFKQPKWTIAGLLKQKFDLNRTKSRLDHLPLNKWHRHTRSMNSAKFIQPSVRETLNPEFCSWAWCKFMECLQSYNIIPNVVVDMYTEGILTELNSVHICEAPGAFISATNHYLKQYMPDVPWNWLATSLNPYYEGNHTDQMINEDKLILYSLDHWTFLKDETGNILSRDNVDNFVNVYIKYYTKMTTPIHFITADGSIDCQRNPSEQESAVAHLHFAEIVTALRILGLGGCFVLKVFTFFECTTICHLYFLACHFKEVYLFKPGTSKEGNSEVYVICIEFTGGEDIKEDLILLMDYIGKSDRAEEKAFFDLSSIDPIFILRIEEAANFFSSSQRNIIERNISTFCLGYSVSDTMYEFQLEVRNKFLEIYNIQPLEESDCLFRGLKKSYRGKNNPITSSHIQPYASELDDESFHQRYTRQTLEFNKQLDVIEQKMYAFPVTVYESIHIISEYKGGLEVEVGKPYKFILSSRFCFSKLLSLRHDLRELLVQKYQNLKICSDPIVKHDCQNPVPDNFHERLHAATELDKQHIEQETKFICFHEFVKIFMTRSDMEVTQKRIATFLQVFGSLEVGQSIFLCSYPLITRLHVGLMFLMTSLFRDVMLVTSKLNHLYGVFLHGFKGFRGELESCYGDLMHLQASLLEGLKITKLETVLEVVPIQDLCLSDHFDPIAAYNTFFLNSSFVGFIADTRESFVDSHSQD